jgi:trimeric autotransporter adhesin
MQPVIVISTPKIANMLNNKFLIGCIVITSMLASCKKSNSYDIKGGEAVKFFTNNESFGNAPQNSVSFSVVNIPDVAGSGLVNLSSTVPTTIKFPVFASREVSNDVTIGVELDNSLIAAYNAAHRTSYEAFPNGMLTNTNMSAHISKGATRSTDSITLTANLAGLNTLTGKAYMAPIKLTTVSNPSVGEITGNTTTQVTYVVFDVELRRIKYLATAAEALGTLITPRTSWSIIFTPAPTSVGGTGSIVDASTTTYSRWSGSPVQVDVNLQATKNVTGIRLYTTNSATNIPTQFEVLLSNDGITYDPIGAPLRANSTYASSYNYILFYKAIPAKYLRLKLQYSTSTSTNNFRIAELDVYAN